MNRALNAVVVTGNMDEFRESVQMVVTLGLSSSIFTFIRGACGQSDCHSTLINPPFYAKTRLSLAFSCMSRHSLAFSCMSPSIHLHVHA